MFFWQLDVGIQSLERDSDLENPQISVERAGACSRTARVRRESQGLIGWVEESTPVMKTEKECVDIEAKPVQGAC